MFSHGVENTADRTVIPEDMDRYSKPDLTWRNESTRQPVGASRIVSSERDCRSRETLTGMTMTNLGWAVVGTGVLADVSIAPAIGALAGSHLAAVCSRSLDKAGAFAHKHQAGGAYDDYATMLADPDVDIVYVASPNALHPQQTLDALERGKHVLVEKPMALTEIDATAMVQAASMSGLKLGVGFHLRHKATARAGRDAIAAGRLGDVFYAEMAIGAGKGLYPYDTWRADPTLAGGGSLLHQGTHAVDLAAFLFGQPISEVTALMDAESDEDVFVGSCRLVGGALVNMSSHSKRAGTRPDWTAFGTDGWLDARGGTSPAPGDTVELHTGGEPETLATSALPAYAEELAAFAEAVRDGREPSGNGIDGLQAVLVSDALYRSAKERRTVSVDITATLVADAAADAQ
jgi:predicted dehydrogenase